MPSSDPAKWNVLRWAGPRRALLPGLIVLGLLLGGCKGTLTFGGTLWTDDDDSAVDDDDTVDDDDDTADDDDTVDDDDSSDDDDATPPGGEVHCGPTVAPGVGRLGEQVRGYTGLSELHFTYVDEEERGGAFTATWAGCEALHLFDEEGDYFCGVLWAATGVSYGEQIMTTQIIVRFDMNFTVAENTCGDHPDAVDRQTYFRLTLPYGGPAATITWASEPNELPANMHEWAEAPYDPPEDEPEQVDLEYFTELSTESN